MTAPSPAIPLLGDRIRAARLLAGLSLRRLAIGMGVSAPFMSDVERGRRMLTERRILDCAHVLGVKPDAFLAVAMPKDTARALERDEALLRAVRLAMSNARVRRAVIAAATGANK